MSERQQKFYAISIWCLVPVLGIIVAIILIFYAIFNLRSKVFLAVLLIEIVLNISITYYMEHEMDRKVFYSPPDIGDTLLRSTISRVKFGYYYYQRKGDKFLLFSTGWDRIPFNDDDIYPHDPLKRDPNILFAK
jgi:hypothetical protein